MTALRDRIPPDSAAVEVGHRARMLAALRAVAGRRDRVGRAVGTALRHAALGGVPAEERAWIDRIEVNRRRIAAGLEIPVAVSWMSLPPIWGRFLLRLARELAPASALELGTGFGLSTSYQTAALELNERGRIVSFDVPDMLEIAAPGLARIGLDDRAELVGGDIAETLPERLSGIGEIDYALVDHDHTEVGTLAAFDALLPHLADGAVVVFDDIGWVDEMRTAWDAIGARARVAERIDLRRLGIAVIGGDG